MSETEDLYSILQVVPDAHPQVIEGAYRALSYLYHPDRNAAPEAAEMREQVERAFEVLSDPVKRKKYNRERPAPEPATHGPAPPEPAPQGFRKVIAGATRAGNSGAFKALVRMTPILLMAAAGLMVIGALRGVGPLSGIVPALPSANTSDVDSIVAGIVGQVPSADQRFGFLTPSPVPSKATQTSSQAAEEPGLGVQCEKLSTEDEEKLSQEVDRQGDAIALNPDDAEAYLKRAIANSRLCRMSEVTGDLDATIRLDPDNAEAHVRRGIARAFLGELDRAVQDYSQAIQIDPESRFAYANRGLAYISLGRDADAQTDLDRAKELGVDAAILDGKVEELRSNR